MKLSELTQSNTIENKPKLKLSDIQKPDTGQITAESAVQHPVGTVLRGLLQPVAQSATGVTMRQRADESTQTPEFDRTAKTRPFDANVPDVKGRALGRIATGEGADLVSTPLNWAGEGLVKGAVGLGKQGAQAIGKATGYEAGRMINSLIKPAQKAFNFGKNSGQQVAREGIVANGWEDLSKKVKDKVADAMKVLNEHIQLSGQVGKVDDYSELMKPLDEQIANAKRLPKSNASLIKRLEDARSDLLGEQEDSLGNKIYTRNLTHITPPEAVQLKRDIGDITKWTKEGSDDETANKALKSAYHIVKEKLEKNIPGIKEANARLANLIDADVAITKRMAFKQKQDMVGGLFEKGSLLTGLYGALTGNVHEAVGGVGVYAIKKLMDSPYAKTRAAQWLNSLSESDMAKAVSEMPFLKGLARQRQFPSEAPDTTKPSMMKRTLYSERGEASVGGEGKGYAGLEDPRMKYFQKNQKYVYNELLKLKPGTPEFDTALAKRYSLVSGAKPTEAELGMSEVEKHNLEQGNQKQILAQLEGRKISNVSKWRDAAGQVAKSPMGLMAGAETVGFGARAMQNQAEHEQGGTIDSKHGKTIGQKNNNAGNLKATQRWEGMTGKDKYGHAIFKNPDYGTRALIKDLQTHKRKNPNQTLKQFMNSYAEKNGSEEAEYIAKYLNISADTKMKDINVYKAAEYLARIESKAKITDDDVSRVRKEFKI